MKILFLSQEQSLPIPYLYLFARFFSEQRKKGKFLREEVFYCKNQQGCNGKPQKKTCSFCFILE